MSDSPDSTLQAAAKPQRPVLFPTVLWVIAIPCIVIELVLIGADLGLWGSQIWRPRMYQYGAFWRGLLGGWRPNYPAQPALMFLTYAFLHAGIVHMAVNMITLFSLGREVIFRSSVWRFSIVYLVSMLTGALGFALFSDAIQPMVGASGALFGLAGAWIIWDFIDAKRANYDRRTLILGILTPVTILIILNIVMFFATGGLLAWETHLGGFVGGVISALLVSAGRPISSRSPD